MPRFRRFVPCLILAGSQLLLGGCVSTIASVVTAPVKAVGKGVDLMTTSQSEADEKRGREMRRRDERLGQLERDYDRNARRCQNGDDGACDRARRDREAIEDLSPRVPYDQR